MSLPQTIYDTAKANGYLSLDLLYSLTTQLGQKQSTGERKARQLAQQGSLVPVYDNKCHLKGYNFNGIQGKLL